MKAANGPPGALAGHLPEYFDATDGVTFSGGSVAIPLLKL
jgi:hypothetical protein